MSRELIQQLKALRHSEVNPREDWLKSNRALLLSQIKNTVPLVPSKQSLRQRHLTNIWAALSIFLPRPLVYNVIRPIAVLLIVAVVATSSWVMSVDAAYEALPGDLLYPAKRASEKTQVAVASIIGGEQGTTKLHIEFAKRRAVEVKKILKQDNPKNAEAVAETVADLKDEIKTVNQKLQSSKQNNISAEVVKDVKDNAEEIKTVLQDVKIALNTSSTLENRVLSKEVSETKDLVKDVSVKAVEVMVTKHLEGDTSISKAEVKQAIDSALQSVTSEVGESKQNVDGFKVIAETAKSEAVGLAGEAKLHQSTSAFATTTAQVAKMTQVVNQTVAAVLKTEVVSATVDKKVTEAKEFLSTGDLTKVVDKLKEATEATKEAEKISDTTLEKTQTVLPIMQVIRDGDVMGTSSPTTLVPLVPFGSVVSGTIMMSSTVAVGIKN